MNALWVGLCGMTIILVAFMLNLFKKITATDKSYILMNFIGGGLLVWYAVLLSSVPFIILNAVWSLSAAWELLQKK